MRHGLRRWKGKSWVVVGIVAAVVITGCSSGGNQVFSGPSAEAVAAELSGKVQGGVAQSTGPTQRSSGGGVTVDVTWKNPNGSGAISFAVAMDTHSVELDGYDLGKLAVLRNDQGQEVRPEGWDAPPGGHHRSGSLTFPSADGSGRPIAGSNTKSIELVIRDVAGVKERVLKWEVAS